MLSDYDLWMKCKTNEPISKEDLGIVNTDHECPAGLTCDSCNGKSCRGKYFMNRSDGITIYKN